MTFTFNASTGTLTSLLTSPGPEVVVDLVLDAAHGFMYASDFDTGTIHVYSADLNTGALNEINGSPFSSPLTSGNGGPIALSPEGNFLFYSDATGHIVTFSILNGVLTPGATVTQDMNQPVQFAVDPAGKFLYAANLSDPSGGEFSVFSVDPNSGALASVVGSPFTFQDNSEPFGIVVHPSGNYIFSSLSNASGIESLTVDRSTGALALAPNSPASIGFFPRYVALSPSGSFLYVSTMGTGSVYAYSVNSSTGALTQVGSRQGDNPNQMVVDVTGKFLIGSIPGFHQVGVYALDQMSGGFSGAPGLVAAGQDPGAIAIVQQPTP